VGLTLQGKGARFGGSAGHHDLQIDAVPEGDKTGCLAWRSTCPSLCD